MVSNKPSTERKAPMVHRQDAKPGYARILIFGVFAFFCFILLFFFRDVIDENFMLGLLAMLAIIGVFFLFGLAIGLVEFGNAKKNEDIGSLFLNSLTDGICIVNNENSIVYANQAYGDLTGAAQSVDLHTLENALSRHDEASNALYRLANNAQRVRDSDEEFRLSNSLDGKQTTPHWYRASVHSMKGVDDGDVKVWRIADISKERDAQEQYFLELQKAIDHLDRAPVGFFSFDSAKRVQYVNATLAEWLRIDLTSFAAGIMQIQDIISEEGLRALLAVKAEPGTLRTAIVEVDMVTDNGERVPVQIVYRVQTHSDGTPAQSRAIVLNRSEGEASTEDLRNSEVRFTRFFNSTPMAIAALDSEGRILRSNTPFTHLFGDKLDVDNVNRALKFETLIHERDHERFSKVFEAACENQADIEPFDTMLADEQGADEKHIRIFMNAVARVAGADEEGVEEAAIVYAMNMTEQKALEGQMAQSQKMQAVGQLAGGIAHDFNNVLTAIIMASDLLLTNHRPSDPSFPDIMNIKQNANRAASLVRQLLAFSRRQTLRPDVLSLTDVLADVRMLLSRLIGNNVTLTIEHGRDLWPVKADLGQFEQVIVNLTVNARDAMPDGGALKITTRNMDAAAAADLNHRGLDDGDYVMIEVSDSGTGIEPDVLEKIFEPFFTTKDVGKGTGLGLSMVYGIIKQTGGFIYAYSELGEGTTFRILLPRHELTEEELAAPKGIDPAAEKKKDLSGSATVLLVEDEDAVRMGGIRALTSRGYNVHEASDGLDALDILEELDGKVDLVVSDVVMPEMDGPSLLREIRKDYPHIKFIFVSGYAEDAFAKNLPEGAQFGFLPKPFSLKQLATVVKETLDEEA